MCKYNFSVVVGQGGDNVKCILLDSLTHNSYIVYVQILFVKCLVTNAACEMKIVE